MNRAVVKKEADYSMIKNMAYVLVKSLFVVAVKLKKL
jgi:hypothetical protein